MRALIDGDAVVYLAALRAEDVTDWGDGNGPIKTLSMSEAEIQIVNYIDEVVQETGADAEPVICLGGSGDYWRKKIYPQYKANRATIQRPELLPRCIDFVVDNYETASAPGLEADDMLGILHTTPGADTVIVSPDKDMRTIPGRLYNPRRKEWETITPSQAFYNHMTQALVGDSTDGYPGCPKVGPKTAPKIIGEYPDEDFKGDKEWAIHLWEQLLEAYAARGLSEAEALVQARVAHILTARYWNAISKQMTLWLPPSSWA